MHQHSESELKTFRTQQRGMETGIIRRTHHEYHTIPKTRQKTELQQTQRRCTHLHNEINKRIRNRNAHRRDTENSQRIRK